MDKITTEEVIDKVYSGTQFTSTEFQEKFQTRGVHLNLSAPEHQ